MKLIPLTKGQFAMVDDEDYQWLTQWKWQCVKGYASRTIYSKDKKRATKVLMHRAIMPEITTKIDHENHNGLDNRRHNLRPATSSQNAANSLKRQNCSSRYKGVYWRSDTQKWRAMIRHEGKLIQLGTYKNEILAAQAYDHAARDAFQEFACLNFPLNIVA